MKRKGTTPISTRKETKMRISVAEEIRLSEADPDTTPYNRRPARISLIDSDGSELSSISLEELSDALKQVEQKKKGKNK
jgi:hypothetical protein